MRGDIIVLPNDAGVSVDYGVVQITEHRDGDITLSDTAFASDELTGLKDAIDTTITRRRNQAFSRPPGSKRISVAQQASSLVDLTEDL